MIFLIFSEIPEDFAVAIQRFANNFEKAKDFFDFFFRNCSMNLDKNVKSRFIFSDYQKSLENMNYLL